MNKKFLCTALIMMAGILVMVGCGTETPVAEPETAKLPVTTAADKDSPIRKIDFKNFEYQLTADLAGGKDKTFTLKDGKLESKDNTPGASLGTIQYADLTGDSKDEAIVDIGMTKEKNVKYNAVYVFTLENEKPKLLWSFDTKGDSAGGLKAISAEKGVLMVEIIGDAKLVKGKWETAASKDDPKGKVTKTQLKWNGTEFAVEGKPEVVEVPSKT